MSELSEKPDSSFDNLSGWFIAKNTSAEAIPPFGVCALNYDAAEGMATVGLPGDNEVTVAINGRSAINPGERGYVHRSFPCAAAVEKSTSNSTAIARGISLGTKSGFYKLQPGGSGFRATSDDIDNNGVINIVPDGDPEGGEDPPLRLRPGADSSVFGKGGGKWVVFEIGYQDVIDAGTSLQKDIELVTASTPFVVGWFGFLVLEYFRFDASEIGTRCEISEPYSSGTPASGITDISSDAGCLFDEVTGSYGGSGSAAITYPADFWVVPSGSGVLSISIFQNNGTEGLGNLTQGNMLVYLWVTGPFTTYPTTAESVLDSQDSNPGGATVSPSSGSSGTLSWSWANLSNLTSAGTATFTAADSAAGATAGAPAFGTSDTIEMDQFSFTVPAAATVRSAQLLFKAELDNIVGANTCIGATAKLYDGATEIGNFDWSSYSIQDAEASFSCPFGSIGYTGSQWNAADLSVKLEFHLSLDGTAGPVAPSVDVLVKEPKLRAHYQTS